MSVRISIAMCTYNGEKYLHEQLESLASQSRQPFELVVCDDGSSDSTPQIIQMFAKTVSFPVRFYVNEVNLGFTANFLKAASLCTGDWIAFCDQDDYWMPQKIEKITLFLDGHAKQDLMMIGHSSLVADAQLTVSKQRLPDFKRTIVEARTKNYGFFCIVGFSMVCNSSLIREINHDMRPFITDKNEWPLLGHDQWLGLLANAVGSIAKINEPLAIWRRHNNSLTRPPGLQSIISQAKIAKKAVSPQSYALTGKMAYEVSQTLRKISAVNFSIYSHNLTDASIKFKKLSDNFRFRADLYEANRLRIKLPLLINLIKRNAYLGPVFYSLGWKSFIKDIAFTVGFLNII